MSQTPTRRRFLTNGVGLVSLAALGGGGLVLATGVDDVIEGIVRHHIGEDRLTAGAARAFAADYAPLTSGSWELRATNAFGLYLLPAFRNRLDDRTRQRAERYDRRVITDFLLSSDYTGEDAGPIAYLGLDPYRACNPYARMLS